MTVYGEPTPSQRLLDKISGQSSDLKERFALLSQYSKLTAISRETIADVQRYLWAEHEAGRRGADGQELAGGY